MGVPRCLYAGAKVPICGCQGAYMGVPWCLYAGAKVPIWGCQGAYMGVPRCLYGGAKVPIWGCRGTRTWGVDALLVRYTPGHAPGLGCLFPQVL